MSTEDNRILLTGKVDLIRLCMRMKSTARQFVPALRITIKI